MIARARLSSPVAVTLLASVLCGACATIPNTRYGVASVEFEGVDEMDEDVLASCLGIYERPWFSFTPDPTCGAPPFTSTDTSLLRWPWTDWPLYDDAIFQRDVERIQRWYRARGFYDATVQSVLFDPESAQGSDRLPTSSEAPCEREGEGEGCELDITYTITEGAPVTVRKLEIFGVERARDDLEEDLLDACQLEIGDRFDEAYYDLCKTAIMRVLRNDSYAKAELVGAVEVDRRAHVADVRFDVVLGRRCRFGEVHVEGAEDIPRDPIVGATLIVPGSRYNQDVVEDAQRSIQALGTFSTVEVVPEIPEDDSDVVDITIRVTRGRLTRFGLGGGVMSGAQGYDLDVSAPQWDLHAIGFFEDRNLFGGLQRIRIEERPRLIFPTAIASTAFSDLLHPRFGNDLRIELRQPAFLEARTTAVISGRWDLGPDPFGARFYRSDIDARLFGLERLFARGRLFGSAGVHLNTFDIFTDTIRKDVQAPSDYTVMFLEQYVRLDLRDDARHPRKGAFFGLGVHEAGYFLPGSWDYLRVTPEARVYLPLPLDFVLAARVSFAGLFVTDADRALDDISQDLGPERYRLRGGGANSNRGYLPGDLGDSAQGGVRRWETSVELRMPLGGDLGVVAFFDMGDVSSSRRIRFDYPHATLGLGLRYQTVVGPLRFDIGGRIPGAQVLGVPDEREQEKSKVTFFGLFDLFPGAVHITIGEAF